jgi:ABC-type cobalamin/Fe3+-siderophores transport system ATPase subunit
MSRATLSGPLRSPGKRGRAKAMEALGSVGLADLAGRRFRDLSGGQQQRVLIARALALEPRVLLLDEPTNGMDLESEHALMELVARLHQDEKLTVVMVSHLLNVVINYARSLVLIEPSAFLAGPIEQVLTVANLERVYGTEVSIGTVGGRRVVLPCTRNHTC